MDKVGAVRLGQVKPHPDRGPLKDRTGAPVVSPARAGPMAKISTAKTSKARASSIGEGTGKARMAKAVGDRAGRAKARGPTQARAKPMPMDPALDGSRTSPGV
jgi:hypothetical protein